MTARDEPVDAQTQAEHTGAAVLRQARRLVVLVIGLTVILAGVAMLVLPGPGWVAIFAGLGILSAEFVWARLWLRRANRLAQRGINEAKAAWTGDGTNTPPEAEASGGAKVDQSPT
ncbi:MAG: PGPGW domain-containing protein [Phycisphaerales bacterium]